MTKVKFQVASRRRRKKVLKKAKGQFGGRSKLYRTAKESVQKGMYYSYRDRKQKKRLFRNLWIARTNAACREFGLSYSKFMKGLGKAKIILNRKILADLAVNDKKAFGKLVDTAKANI
ncbi:MAG: 50S ribosomal protein L20 [Candidatus Omnitrophica bacterium]|nr:50S ribosomal protein L20 [Candidatus Omnitrophota bacterium]